MHHHASTLPASTRISPLCQLSGLQVTHSSFIPRWACNPMGTPEFWGNLLPWGHNRYRLDLCAAVRGFKNVSAKFHKHCCHCLQVPQYFIKYLHRSMLSCSCLALFWFVDLGFKVRKDKRIRPWLLPKVLFCYSIAAPRATAVIEIQVMSQQQLHHAFSMVLLHYQLLSPRAITSFWGKPGQGQRGFFSFAKSPNSQTTYIKRQSNIKDVYYT